MNRESLNASKWGPFPGQLQNLTHPLALTYNNLIEAVDHFTSIPALQIRPRNFLQLRTKHSCSGPGPEWLVEVTEEEDVEAVVVVAAAEDGDVEEEVAVAGVEVIKLRR